ncbi:MAG: 30S ribosomal protein S1 [Deinococcales bacterium]
MVDRVRGGLVANLGVRAFLPASQVDVRRVGNLEPYVGQRLKVRIIELNRKRNRIIISRRSILEEELAGKKAETLKNLAPGAVVEGDVVEITDFGAFINLGGVDGLVHRSEIGYQRFNHPREVLKLGQMVKAEVLDMDLSKERINLSMKKLITDPWESVASNYQIGQKIEGKVTNLTPFGAFVELEPGLEGLIHVSEMSWTKRVRHPKEVLKEGDHVEAMILKIDTPEKRVSLGLRQTMPDPWSSLPDRYPPGTEINSKVTGITEFGVFMEIEEGIEGLIHISELAHERIDNISEHFKKGDEISAVILNIDPVEQRASLSRKRLLPYTPPEIEDRPQRDRGDDRRGSGAGGRSKGRRGGRRGQSIDYDYGSSYSLGDNSGKSVTKLGDVYADLFAQFGLSDSKAAPAEPKAKAQSESSVEAKVEAPRSPEAQAETPAKEPKPQVAPVKEVKAEEPVDPENAIDAAEAAALLTMAFREGKRPVNLQNNAETESVSEESDEQA